MFSKETNKALLELCIGTIYQRCDSLSEEVDEKEDIAKSEESIQENIQALKEKTSPEGHDIIAMLIDNTESHRYQTQHHFYLAGFMDGMRTVQAILMPRNNGDNLVINI